MLLLVAVLTFVSAPGLALDTHEYPAPSPLPSGRVQFPTDAQTPGERNPWIALLAATTIVLAGVAGIYIYRLIKKGI